MERLETERLVIRRFVPADGPALHAYLSLPEAVRFEPYGVQSAADCQRLAGERATDPAFWAVCLAGTGELIGNLYLGWQEPHAWSTYELGYVFNPGYWGHGYAAEAARALVTARFAHGAHRIVARCNPENERSWRLLQRLGLRREAHMIRAASFTSDDDGQPIWHDTYLYATLAEEWSSSQAKVAGE